MFKLTVLRNGAEYTIPKENLKMFAIHEALQRGITHGKIHDNETAIEFLYEIGIKAEEM